MTPMIDDLKINSHCFNEDSEMIKANSFLSKDMTASCLKLR